MQQRFLSQILLLAQHVSGITMPIIRSSRVLYHYAHHQELKSIIQWLLRVVFCAVVSQVAGLQDAAASCKPDA